MSIEPIETAGFKPRLEYVDVSPADAFEAVALFEALEPDTLGFIELPKCVYVGTCSLSRNVNVRYCKTNNIPIVRGVVAGRSVSYQGNDNIWVIFSMKEPMKLDTLCKILLATFDSLGIDAIIQDNDVRVEDRRVAMFSSMSHTLNLGVEICLSADFEKINKTLKFPPEKWRNKPTDKIEDWILPLNSILGSTAGEQVKSALISKVEDELATELARRDLRDSELTKMAALSKKYHSEVWIKQGKWSPVKDYWRPK